MKWLIPFLMLVVASIFIHLRTVPPTPIETAIENATSELLFGGTLSNEVVATTTTEAANTATEISSPGLVWTSDTNGYIFYESAGGGLWMSSTTNSGATWTTGTRVDSVNTTDVVSYGVWWEGWTPGTTTTRYIHIVTTDLGVDDTYYTRLDTQTGGFSTTVLGTTQGALCADGSDCYTSITMSATGTLMMTAADGSDSWVVRCGRYLSCSTASNWHETFATGVVPPYLIGGAGTPGDDQPILLPVPGTDNIMLIYNDTSLETFRYNIYSATSSSWWANSTAFGLVGSVEFNATYDAQFFGATLSTTTGLLYWAVVDDANDYITADHDIPIYSFSTTTWTWTQKTFCTTSYTGGVTGVKLSYDAKNDTLYCIMGLRTTIGTNTTGGIYYKTSTDNGTTWSATSSMVNDNADDINGLTTNIISYDRIGVTWNYTTAPRADDQYYDDIVDLFIEAGGGTPSTDSGIIWFD